MNNATLTQSNPNCSHYNACLIDLTERIDAGAFASLDEIEALAADMPQAWQRSLISDALDSIASR